MSASVLPSTAQPDAAIAALPTAAPCRNCGEPAPGTYCPACGQATRLHPPSVGEFLHEFVGHYIALEGSLWRTLAMLLLRPGRLTLDYLQGRRARYLPPLRLYLTFSVLLVALTAWNHSEIRLGRESLRFSMATDHNPNDRNVVIALVRSNVSTGIRPLDEAVARVSAMSPAERSTRMQEGVHRLLPYALILYVPAFALILKLAFRRRHMLYGEHLVTAFHAQTVLFIASLVSLLPLPGWAGNLVLVLLVAHWFIALRTVYGGRLWVNALRSSLLLAVYGALLFAVLLLMATASILIGA
jgi:hypothetical protein